MVVRRTFILVGALLAFPGCEPARPSVDTRPVVLCLSPAGESYEIRVDNELADLHQLDEVVLAHALTNNPSLTEEQARANVRIYIFPNPNVRAEAVAQDILPALRGFSKIGLVAEDRR